jgi:hypothetical protein
LGIGQHRWRNNHGKNTTGAYIPSDCSVCV